MTAQHANFRGKLLFQTTKTTPKQQLNDEKCKVGYLSALVKLFCCVVLVSSVWTTFGWYDLVRGRFSRCAIGAIRGIAFLCLVRFNATCDVVFFSCCAIGPHDLPLMLYDYCNCDVVFFSRWATAATYGNRSLQWVEIKVFLC